MSSKLSGVNAVARYTDLELMRTKFKFQTRPVNCRDIMQPQFVEYVEGESFTYIYPVLEMYLNPRRSMQGGFIAAAFDNAFGALVYLTTGRLEMASVDMHVNYQRPIFENDRLTVTVFLKAKGRTMVHASGEACDQSGCLIATAATNIMLLDKESFLRKDE
jgi:acyl-coenzyme A thioesterase PaaI-like protein